MDVSQPRARIGMLPQICRGQQGFKECCETPGRLPHSALSSEPQSRDKASRSSNHRPLHVGFTRDPHGINGALPATRTLHSLWQRVTSLCTSCTTITVPETHRLARFGKKSLSFDEEGPIDRHAQTRLLTSVCLGPRTLEQESLALNPFIPPVAPHYKVVT